MKILKSDEVTAPIATFVGVSVALIDCDPEMDGFHTHAAE